MLSNNQVKHINALKIKKYRDEYREFIAEGNTLVTDLIRSAYGITGIYALSSWITDHLDQIRERNIAVYQAEPFDMERITSLSNPSPVLAIVKIPAGVSAGSFESDPAERLAHGFFDELALMLENLSDPGNFGTMLRIADWFGIKTIICSPNSVELYNPKVVQSSMGSIARVNVIYTDLKLLLTRLKGKVQVYGTFLEGESLYSKPLSPGGIILIGSEAHGISEELKLLVSEKLFIPSFGLADGGKAESLNAAVAAAVVISEFRRRQM